MGWATNYINKLKTDGTVSFRPRGNSMSGKIESGELCTVATAEKYSVGDIVLCKVGSRQFLHLIKAIQGERYQIANNKGFVNGWIGKDSIYGVVISIGN